MAPVTEGSHGFETLLRILQKYSSTPTGLAGSKNLTTDKNFLICECVLYFFFEWATPLMGKNSNPGKCKKRSLHSVHIAGLCM